MDERRRQRQEGRATTATGGDSRAVRRRVDQHRNPEQEGGGGAAMASAASSAAVVAPRGVHDFPTEAGWWLVDLEAHPVPKQGATPLVKRCMREYDWDEGKARRVLRAYRQFLGLKKRYRDYNATLLSPSLSVDLMWHQHILDVVNYVNDCVLLCDGRVVGHNPDGAHEGGQDREGRRSATQSALLEYQDQLGLEYEEWKELFQNTTAPDDLETPNPHNETTIRIHVLKPNGRRHTIRVPPTTGRLSDVCALVAAVDGRSPRYSRYIYERRQIIDFDVSPSSLGMADESNLHVLYRLCGC
jgi:hypothetical protein